MKYGQFELRQLFASLAIFGATFGLMRLLWREYPRDLNDVFVLALIASITTGAAIGILFRRPFLGAFLGGMWLTLGVIALFAIASVILPIIKFLISD